MRRKKNSGGAAETNTANIGSLPAEARTGSLFEDRKDPPYAFDSLPPGAVLSADGKPECGRCGQRLTTTRGSVVAWPCGHEGNATASRPEDSRASDKQHHAKTDAPDPANVVRVVWGKELFSPKQFHSFEVGPFEGSTTLRPGETHAQAMARLMVDLRAFRDEEIPRKWKAYLKAIGDTYGERS